MYGGDGDDILCSAGTAGHFYGGYSADTNGTEDGSDTASFKVSSTPVEADLSKGFASQNDPLTSLRLTLTLYSIENLRGGPEADTLTGDANDNVFTFSGGDTIDGGDGIDTYSLSLDRYFGAFGDDTLAGFDAVFVPTSNAAILTPTISNASGTVLSDPDTVGYVEWLEGSIFDDKLNASAIRFGFNLAGRRRRRHAHRW